MSQTLVWPIEQSMPAGNGLVHYTRPGRDYPVLVALAGPIQAISEASSTCGRDIFHLYGCFDGTGQMVGCNDAAGARASFMLCRGFLTPLDILPQPQPGYWLALDWPELADIAPNDLGWPIAGGPEGDGMAEHDKGSNSATS